MTPTALSALRAAPLRRAGECWQSVSLETMPGFPDEAVVELQAAGYVLVMVDGLAVRTDAGKRALEAR